MKRRITSVILTALLLLSALPFQSVFAIEMSADTVNGYYEDGVWMQGGTGAYSFEDETLTLSKTAVPKRITNEYDVTVSVRTKCTKTAKVMPTATVLIVDTSSSMVTHKNVIDVDGKTKITRLKAAQTALTQFIDSYKDFEDGSNTYVSIILFNGMASLKMDWLDMSIAANRSTALDIIGGLKTDYGTNLDDALYYAIDRFASSQTAIAGVAEANRNVILFTDGQPTYCRDQKGTPGIENRLGQGTHSKMSCDAASATSAKLRSLATVYTLCFGVANDSAYSGGPTCSDFLKNSIATRSANTTKYAYDCMTSKEQLDAYRQFFRDINSYELKGITGANAFIVDPLPENITMKSVPEEFEYSEKLKAYVWKLDPSKVTPVVNGDVTTYNYSVTYTLVVNADADGYDDTEYHPLNGITTFDAGNGNEYAFPVPAVKGKTTEYTVTYNCGDGGVLEGQNTDGNITATVKAGSDTPAPPAVIPDDDRYFTGWSPAVSDKVTESVTYVAQYAKKGTITVGGFADGTNKKTVTYNGNIQTFTDFVSSGLPSGAVLSGVSFSVSGKNVGEYKGEFTGTPVVTKNEIDVTEQYKFSFGKPTLTIEKAELTVTAESAEKQYDGNDLTKDSYKSKGLVGDDKLTDVTVTGSIKNVGETDNVPSDAIIMNEDVDVTENYDITYVNGTLTITAIDGVTVSVKENSNKVTYDGTEKTVTGYTVESVTSPLYNSDCYEFDGDASASGTNVGTYDMNIVPGDFTNTSKNFTNVTFDITDGSLEITKSKAAKFNDGKTKGYKGTYDGKEHDGVALWQIDGAVSGTEWTIKYNGEDEMPKYTEVGTYPIVITAENENYETITKTVTAEITPATVTVKADPKSILVGDEAPELTYTNDAPVEGEIPVFEGELATDEEMTRGSHPITKGTLTLVEGDGFDPSNYVLKYVGNDVTVLLMDYTVKISVDKKKTVAGTTVVYKIEVTNIGDVDIENIHVVAEKINADEIISELLVGDTWMKEYKYTVGKNYKEDDFNVDVVSEIIGTDFGKKAAETVIIIEKPEAPKTGDTEIMPLWIALSVISAGAVLTLFSVKRKKEEE